MNFQLHRHELTSTDLKHVFTFSRDEYYQLYMDKSLKLMNVGLMTEFSNRKELLRDLQNFNTIRVRIDMFDALTEERKIIHRRIFSRWSNAYMDSIAAYTDEGDNTEYYELLGALYPMHQIPIHLMMGCMDDITNKQQCSSTVVSLKSISKKAASLKLFILDVCKRS
ncbi:unnamed protein product [Phytophthora lilii]|uniref:Unnamed protein product n=1 Tax=Phytophthora lilii TaxID=2077276 RepID=A0A9W6YJX6_9STRA|nr:unnamed protein product [Phytophthora lilii]